MTYYIHNIPGRLRVKTPILKNNLKEMEKADKLLQSIQGIEDIEFNSITGSVVILYDYNLIDSETILNILKQEGYVDLVKAITNDQYIHKIVTGAGKVISQSLSEALLDSTLGHTPLSFVTAFI